jgi:flavin reductase (DIM6/NTAB) family NADH-FMN oxidoreductase RutF
MIIDPHEHQSRDVYKLLIGAVVPRPIAFVSSLSANGIRNLAPFSFFTVVSANPPVICFCPMRRASGGGKDTLQNVRDTGEFVVNIVSEEIVVQMNKTSGNFPPEVDEFVESGLTPLASDLIRPARVKECGIAMECRLRQIVDVSDRPMGGSLVLGDVLRFHVRDDWFDTFRIDPDKLRAIGRMGGPTYARTTDRFDIERP